MKKALYLSVATALLFAVILAGCQDGLQETLNEQIRTYPALPAPKNLKTTVSPGAIVIGWDAVKDAASYEVYRRDTVTQQSRQIASLTVAQTSYIDKVGYDNYLADGRKYTYTVVALGKTVGSNNVILNGEATVDATAQIPPRGSDEVITAEAIKELASRVIVNTNGQDTLEVTWIGDPLLIYSALYTYGNGTVPLRYNLWNDGNGGGNILGSVYKRHAIPLVGGATTVEITAKWEDNDREYYKNVVETETFEAAATLLANVKNFDVTAKETGIYTITWEAVEGAGSGLAGYDIWKAELIGNILDDGSYTDGDVGYEADWPSATLGEWEPVIGTLSRDGNKYTLIETREDVDTSKKYFYGIVAKNSDSGVKSGLSTKIVNAIVVPAIATTFVNGDIVEIKGANGKPQLIISVDVVAGETVTKLERAEAVFASAAAAEPQSVGGYAELPVATRTNIGAYSTWIDTQTAIRASYAYRLTITKDGGYTKEIVAYKKDGSYTPFIDKVTVSVAPALAKVYSLKISLDSTLAYTGDLTMVNVYQAEVNSTGATILESAWTPVTIPAAQSTYEKLSTVGFIQSGLTAGKYYAYRVVLTSKDGENPEKTVSNPASSDGIQPSVASPSSTGWAKAVGTVRSGIALSGSADDDPPELTKLEKAKVFVVDDTYKKVTGAAYETIIDKAGSVDMANPDIAAYSYFILFSNTDLSALKDTGANPKLKTYYLVAENNTGVYADSDFSTFTVDTDGKVEWLAP
ncbi:MAG: fibronectin type III domain-containing protein [Treponema sp.]|jgi:hypothetical protein|nr:fibronectin type III domain-containing protein [Treponema sp.]